VISNREIRKNVFGMTFHIALFALLTLSVGYAMAWVGIQKSALEWRRRRRRCPSCGRQIVARTCPCTAAGPS
jgi:hypothetical protein